MKLFNEKSRHVSITLQNATT